MQSRAADGDFNPRSREGSDIFRLPQSIRSDISIHAPAKGATRELRDADEWEVLFQSTLPRRERLERKLHNKQTDIISIHAPAKGATDYFFIQLAQSKISIHAPAKGATACSAAACGADCHFNPRSREGSDSTTASRRSRDSHFNPRSREGSDPAPPRCRHLHHSISIHAPAKGATQDIVCLWITL